MTARRRFGQIHSQNVRVGANVKFPREYTRFDGTTGIELTVHDGENKHVLPAFDVHGPILIPRSETATAVESVEPAPSHAAPAVSSEPSVGAPAASNAQRPEPAEEDPSTRTAEPIRSPAHDARPSRTSLSAKAPLATVFARIVGVSERKGRV